MTVVALEGVIRNAQVFKELNAKKYQLGPPGSPLP